MTQGGRELVSYYLYDDATSNGGAYDPEYGDEYYDDGSLAGYVEQNNLHGTIENGYFDNPYPVGDGTDPSRYVEKGENFVRVSKTITIQLNNTSEYKCQGFFYGSSRVFDTRNLTVVSDVVVRIAVSNETPNNGQGFDISCNVTGGEYLSFRRCFSEDFNHFRRIQHISVKYTPLYLHLNPKWNRIETFKNYSQEVNFSFDSSNLSDLCFRKETTQS